MNRTPEEIYEVLCPGLVDDPTNVNVEQSRKIEENKNIEDLSASCDNHLSGEDTDAYVKNNQNKTIASSQSGKEGKCEAIGVKVETDYSKRDASINDDKIHHGQHSKAQVNNHPVDDDNGSHEITTKQI